MFQSSSTRTAASVRAAPQDVQVLTHSDISLAQPGHDTAPRMVHSVPPCVRRLGARRFISATCRMGRGRPSGDPG